jgi:hypothetical protein
MLMLIIFFRASDTSSSNVLYPTFLLIVGFMAVGRIMAFDRPFVASFRFTCQLDVIV